MIGAATAGCAAVTGAMGAGRAAGAEAGVGLDRVSAAGGALAAVPSAITATTAPTGATSPAGTRISASTPAVVDGTCTSIDTLSVSISNRLSPGLMASPADLNHCVILPFATVSPSCGISTSIASIPRAPAFGFENSSKLNYITATFSVAPQASIFNKHLRRVGCVAIAKQNEIECPSFQPPCPIGLVFAVFVAL